MINHFTQLLYQFKWSHVMKQQNKHFTQLLQYNVSHVSWLRCYFILVTLLPCCHVSRYEKSMLHSHVALPPFISNKVRNKQNMQMLHMYVSMIMAWWHRWCICLWNDMQFSGSQTPTVAAELNNKIYIANRTQLRLANNKRKIRRTKQFLHLPLWI
jgi:hypothetical protein